MKVRRNILVSKCLSPISLYLSIEKLMAFPTANKKEGKTRSVGVNPCQRACSRGANASAPLPPVFTIIIKQMVIPLKTSSDKKRSRVFCILNCNKRLLFGACDYTFYYLVSNRSKNNQPFFSLYYIIRVCVDKIKCVLQCFDEIRIGIVCKGVFSERNDIKIINPSNLFPDFILGGNLSFVTVKTLGFTTCQYNSRKNNLQYR